jgi:hypothetical protein
VGTPICKFSDEEIELVILEYLVAHDITGGRTPADIAREIV